MLQNVYENLKSRIGFKDSERDAVVAKINDAWREIWDSNDIPESKDEIIVDINVEAQLVTMPWFCEHIRKMRYFNGRLPITQENQINRYHENWGNEVWVKQWRKKTRTCLARNIDNFSQLVVSIPLPESEDIVVTVIGETTNSAKTRENITITAGSTGAVSVGNFTSQIASITKDRQTTYDVTVADINENVLTVIPNHLLTFRYLIVQILDQIDAQMQQYYSSVEVHYKKQFEPVLEDTDEFVYTDRYDMAIVWKYLEQNKNDVTSAAAAQLKCTQILNQVIDNEAVGVHSQVNFKEQPYFRLPYRMMKGRVPIFRS